MPLRLGTGVVVPQGRRWSNAGTPWTWRIPLLTTALAKLFAAKIAAATVASATVGTVAVAAATGSLPAPLQTVAHNAFAAPAPGASVTVTAAEDGSTEQSPIPGATGEPTATPTGEPSATGTPTASPTTGEGATETEGTETPEPAEPTGKPTAAPTVRPTDGPGPSLAGLCNAWRAGGGHEGESHAFSVLISRAGGTSAIDAFCATVLGGPAPAVTRQPGRGDDDERSHQPTTATPTARPTAEQGKGGENSGHGGGDRSGGKHVGR
jgi:hypothetical protein